MATSAPVAPSAPAAPAAPQAAPPSAARLSPNEQIASALQTAPASAAPPIADPSLSPAPAAPQAPADALEAALVAAGVPQTDPAWQRLQGLRTVEGRAGKLSEFESRAATFERMAEQLAIEAVQAGADARVIAAKYGIDQQELIQATGWQPQGAIAPGSGGPGVHPLARGGQPQPAEGAFDDTTPIDFARLFHSNFVAAADPAHANSWSKGYFDAMEQAAALRESADVAAAEAFAADDPTQKALKTRAAETARAQARQAEQAAILKLEERRAGMLMRVFKHLDARLGKYEQADQQREQAAQADQQRLQAFDRIGSEMRGSRLPDGSAEFGPNGYGLFEVDANGNCVNQLTPHGEVAIEQALSIMSELGMPPGKQSMVAALEILATRILTASEGGEQAPAGASAGGGGDVTLPSGSVPGGGYLRPSPQAPAQSGGDRMF